MKTICHLNERNITLEKPALQKKHIFLNHLNQIHWYWRVFIFLLFFFAVSLLLLGGIFSGIAKPKEPAFLRDFFIFLPNAAMALITALITWFVLRFVDRRSFQSVGLAFHSRWRSEFFFGLFIGAAIPFLIAVILSSLSMITLNFRGMDYGEAWAGIFLNLGTWIALGFFYEMVFRGYLLQTMAEGLGKIAASLSLSLFYGMILGSGQNQPVVSVINVSLAGLVYCFCYFRTRALWAGLGLHIMWNFVQSYVFGSRVERFQSSFSVYRVEYDENIGWNGGHFGIDGGWIGTIILVIMIWYVSHTRMLRMTEDMRKIKYQALTTPFKANTENEENDAEKSKNE